MKFYKDTFSINKKYAEELRHKITIFKEMSQTRKNVFLTFITTYGIKENEYSYELVQNSLTMDDLFLY
jgi:hypothetical protein